MSRIGSPLEQAQLTVTRLNRAATDLGLHFNDHRPIFVLDSHSITVGPNDDEAVTVYDIAVNGYEFEDYNRLATMLEQLAEAQAPKPHGHEMPGQMRLFDPANPGV